MQDIMTAPLRVYKWPAQAFWRYFEVQALRKIPCERPILEIGCGDGKFSSLIFSEIDDAIDVNPRSVEKCRKSCGQLYRRIRCLDARELDLEDGGFATVYANCVVEHIPEIRGVLLGCFRGLRPGGKLVITVPLVRMNRHLLLPWRWYARLRQQQLVHINLLSEESWEAVLRDAGFSEIEFRPYLSGKACKFWDTIDSPSCFKVGRYGLAPALGILAQKLLPRRARQWAVHHVAAWLSKKAQADTEKDDACATVVIARKIVAGDIA
jgi:SAM-dependent methyltransferase